MKSYLLLSLIPLLLIVPGISFGEPEDCTTYECQQQRMYFEMSQDNRPEITSYDSTQKQNVGVCYDAIGNEWESKEYSSLSKYPLISKLLQEGFGSKDNYSLKILHNDYKGTSQYESECGKWYKEFTMIRGEEEKWKWMCPINGEFPNNQKLNEMYLMGNVCSVADWGSYDITNENMEWDRNKLINELKNGDILDEYSNCGSLQYEVNNRCVTKTLWNQFQDLHYLSDDPNLPVCPDSYILENNECILQKSICGKGTIEQNGVCVVDPDYKQTTETKSRGGGCLIATATFDSELAPQVQKLREIRDSKLLQTESGSQFMEHFNSFYYSFSPIIADYERENPVFKEIVKVGITPMLSTLSLMDYADTESEVLGIGISLIILNAMMYVGLPVFGIIIAKKR